MPGSRFLGIVALFAARKFATFAGTAQTFRTQSSQVTLPLLDVSADIRLEFVIDQRMSTGYVLTKVARRRIEYSVSGKDSMLA